MKGKNVKMGVNYKPDDKKPIPCHNSKVPRSYWSKKK